MKEQHGEVENAQGFGEQADTPQQVSRRGFLAGASVMAVGTLMGLAGCANPADGGAEEKSESKPEAQAETTADAPQAAPTPEYLPASWDAETDVVIVGYGGAGAAAALTMESENLGEYLVFDAAPEDGVGGNTRLSGNIVLIPDNTDDAMAYQKTLNGTCVLEDDLLKAWATNLCDNGPWLADLGVNMEPVAAFSPEFPECPGSASMKCYCADGKIGNNSLWNALMEVADDFDIEVTPDARVTSVVRNPLTNEALGVVVDQSGKSTMVKARKGVILSCGGFENNPELKASFLPAYHDANPFGTPYNRGDGFALVAPFGAQLRNLSSFAGSSFGIYAGGKDIDNVNSSFFGSVSMALHDYIIVGSNGKRFMYEESGVGGRHGKVSKAGVYSDLFVPHGAWAVFGQTWFDNMSFNSEQTMGRQGWINCQGLALADNPECLEKGVIVRAETVEELAELTGIDAANLAKTLDTYNNVYVANQKDEEFGRGTGIYSNFGGMAGMESISLGSEDIEVVAPFDLQPITAPFYATPLPGSMHNTQGGPKRNGDSQTLDMNDEVIPRLYSCGEFGAPYGYMYNGGGNISDALATGRMAARHAASLQPWE